MATCVVGLMANGDVWLGGDSCGSTSYCKEARYDTKVFALSRPTDNEVVGFAFCGSYRLGQVIQYKFKIPDHPDPMSDHEYLVTNFLDSLRKTLSESGCLKKEDEIESMSCECSIIVGYRGHLYVIEEDLQVGLGFKEYVAAGSGAAYALGAFFATSKTLAKKPKDRIVTALRAGSEYAPSCAPPYRIMQLFKETNKIKEWMLPQ